MCKRQGVNEMREEKEEKRCIKGRREKEGVSEETRRKKWNGKAKRKEGN